MKERKINKSTRDQIVADHFAELNRHLLPASIATLKRSKQVTPTESCFGGVFVGRKDSQWPHQDSRPLEGVLQIRTKDLPCRPKQLDNIALIQLFCVCDCPDKGFPVMPDFDADDWFAVRTYATLRGLRPMDRPARTHLKSCRIEWNKVENEIPTYPDDIGLVDDEKQERFRELDDWAKLERKHYSAHERTKVGGWPVSCQNGLNYRGYCIQIGSEEKANFMWGHDGVAVLYRIRNKWSLDWDCF
ncbi:DUF1963 domain-containing protein [Stieleria sp. ICT_E10.1]|uniref:DUF1963 domain-containing protein n=1 Tax=Stieleria sedimenti TaxID=2976331 RepID=UPI00217F4FB4|nr:DUF1963 domain-containing protein [Stieleria sedimenti]MCS7466052.1 DUF1963 domain-containing protein [Stieleria sedimenti]